MRTLLALLFVAVLSGIGCIESGDGELRAIGFGDFFSDGDTETDDTDIHNLPHGECSDEGTIIGTFNTAEASIQYDTAVVSFIHNADASAEDGGCITSVDITLSTNGGCELRIVASHNYANEDSTALEIQSLEFHADSDCPDFTEAKEGVYSLSSPMTQSEVGLLHTAVSGSGVEEAVLNTTVSLRLEGVLFTDSAQSLAVSNSSLGISGCFNSTGSDTASCPCEPECGAKQCGPNACGGFCGECPTGVTCSASGYCVQGDYWDDGECPGWDAGSGLLFPVSNDCRGVGWIGCCEQFDTSRVLYCEDGLLYCVPCPQTYGGFFTCSWNASIDYYYCTDGDYGSDPSGTYPRTCP